ncbi:MAG: DNA-3-methyladenine glycosylase [Candidatus Pelagisphaera sp.]|jgi:DNA-3-methyladenine glycosylase
MKRLVEADFCSRDTVALARSLIGKYLVMDTGEENRAFIITEAEAYDGPEDLACHASKGRTKRTETLFGPPGHWYVYLCYGVHEMLNLVTGPVDYPAAILIRGLDEVSGPGRLTKRLGINRRFNTQRASEKTGLWLEDRGIRLGDSDIEATPRIGVDYAGDDWANRPYRFVLKA